MTNNIDRAAEIIAGETQELGRSVNRAYDRALLAARRLADAGLLMPDLPADHAEGVDRADS